MGFAQYMVSSYKSNSRRPQRLHFDKKDNLHRYTFKQKKPVYKKATKELLLKIRKETRTRNRINQRKFIGFTILASIAVIFIIIYGLTHVNLSI